MMSDRHDHYLTAVAELSQAAALGGLTMDFELDKGRTVSGVPEPRYPDAESQEVNDTGFADEVRVGPEAIALTAVVAARVSAPER